MEKLKQIGLEIAAVGVAIGLMIMAILKILSLKGDASLQKTEAADAIVQAQVATDETKAADAVAEVAVDQTKIDQDQAGTGDVNWQSKR